MLDISDLFKKINAIDHRKIKSNHKHKLNYTGKTFDSKHIFELLEHVKYVVENGIRNFDLRIVINVDIIADEAVLILFESIIYYLLKNNICSVTYTFIVDKNYLSYAMFRLNNLYNYNTKNVNKEKYLKFYDRKTYIYQNHYRKLCVNNEKNKVGPFLSILLGDITTFLSTNIMENCVDELAEAIVEIVDNALSHSNSDCLVDIKVLKDPINKYTYVNVTTVSIGDILVSSNIREYIEKKDKSGYSDKNEIVLKAYSNHKDKFNEYYDIDTFCLISAFQKYVTTRKRKNSGGTGLTTLIEQLRLKASKDYCYVLSGNDIILFRKGFLELTKDGLIGFNEDNDYINKMPSKDIVYKNSNVFNGVIYNLSFILNESEEKDE